MNDRNIEAIYPLAPSQHGMLLYLVLTERSAADRSDAYFEQFVCDIEGELDSGLFRRTWERLVERHPALRTFFIWERRERPLQVVAQKMALPFEIEDWRDRGAERQESDFAAFAAADKRRLFELDRPPLLRFFLFRLGETRWRLLWSYSHLLIDGWSLGALFSEAFETYRRLAAGEPVENRPGIPFKRFVDWAEKQDPARAETFYRRELAGLELPTQLPYDRDPAARVGSRTAHSAASASLETRLGGLGPRLEELARSCRATPSVVYQAAFGLLLASESGEPSVVYGSIFSGRPPKLAGVEEIVGLFVNGAPIRFDRQPGQTLRGLLETLKQKLIEQREFENFRLSDLLRWLGLPFDRPLFEHAIVFENYPRPRKIPGLAVAIRELPEVTSHALMLYVEPEEDDVLVRLVYENQRYSAAEAERFFARYLALLEAFAGGAETPLDQLPPLAAAERRELLARGDGGERPAAREPVFRAFEARAAERPEAVAVAALDGSAALTYGELERRANRLAHHLLALGAAAGEPVLVALDRRPELLVALLAIHKAGAAYLPVDPAAPAERLAFLAADAQVRFAFVGGKAGAKLREAGLAPAFASLPLAGPQLDALPAEGPALEVPLSSLAYVIYTSGSTGQAKGVLVEHAQLAHYSRDAAEVYGIGAADRVLQFASIGFDTSAEEIWPALAAGATLLLRDEEMIASPAAFLARLGDARVSLLNLPTAYWHELCAELGAPPEDGGAALPAGLRGVIIGGEAASPERLERWLAHLAAAGRELPLWNTYGPTETTIVATRARLDGWTAEQFGGEVPIGRAIAGMRARVVGRDGRLRPAGLPGELHLAGAGVARGYLGRAGLSAERFLADGLAAEGDRPGRVYATGDRVLMLEDGTLLFRGRIDQQVKVRGYRVEPGEIEAALRRHPEVLDAVVQLRPLGNELRLVAWLVAAQPERAPAAAELRAFLAASLPEYMLPTAFLALGAFPLTPSGKIDRRTLPTPDASLLSGGLAEEDGPRTPVEELLAGLWCELLGVERVARGDDFFRLGGHSLLVGRMTSRLRKQLGVELPLVAVFESSTLEKLAARLQAALQRAEGGEGGDQEAALPPIESTPRDGRPLPLSYPQERVWLIHQLEPLTIAYNFQATFSFDGPLDVAALEAALSEIVRRHEIFRTRFPATGDGPVMAIEKPFAIALPVTDLSHLPIAEANARAEAILEEETRVPFALDRLPLIRWRLLRLAPGFHQLIQLEHHFVHDGWSLSVLIRELTALYRAFAAGKGSPLAEMEVQYADFAYWQRRTLEGPTLERLAGWWRKNLEGMPTVLELPMDRPRPEQPSSRGAAKNFLLPGKLYAALRQWSREQGFTLYMTMLAGFAALMYRYTGSKDFGLGGGVANRRQQAQQGLIGMIVNSVVLRCRLDGDPTFLELVRRMRRTSIEAYEHQDMPFEKLVSELRPERHPSRNPLFQVMFSFHDAAMPPLDFGPGLEVRGLVRTNRSAKLDLNVILSPQAEQRVGQQGQKSPPLAIFTWEYNRDLFDDATMKRMMRHYLDLLAAAIAQPEQRLSQLAMTSAAERAALAAASVAPSPAPREASLAELWRRAAEPRPDAVAVVAGAETLTYGQLDRRSTRLAELLLEAGVAPGELVGLAVERGLDLPLGMLGILKAGGAYAPLDPAYPAERLQYMAADTGMRRVVAHAHLASTLPVGLAIVDLDGRRASLDEEPRGLPLPRVDGGFPAYALYTSGSTGRPKGVLIPQRAVARLVLGTDFLQLGPGGSTGQVANASFDAVTFEVWAPLLNGGRMVAVDRETLLSPPDLAAELERHPVDAVFFTAAFFHQMVRERPEILRSIGTVIFGGERAEPAIVREALALGACRLMNGYGPTECTTFALCHPVETLAPEAASVPIGRPIAGTEAYVLDRDGQLCPAGVPGELYLGGAGLALGYHRRPALTAEKFVPHPLAEEPGARLYRTGDLVKRLPGGEIDFLGRLDQQVKLRGFRIELGEIEAALARQPGVDAAAVLLREDRPGDKRLVAYATLRSGEAPAPETAAELRAALRRSLPEFTVPAEVVILGRFPVNANGKLDRRALPPPERQQAEEIAAPPETDTEKRLAALFCTLLGLASVGVNEDFFALGGHSLMATLLASRVAAEFGRKLTPSQIFTSPRLRDLAAAIENAPPVAEAGPIRREEEADLLARAEQLGDRELDALLGEMQGDKSG